MTSKELSPEQKRTYFILLGIMIFTGALNTIFLTLQNSSYKKILDAPFHHPWFQSLQMFVGEAYCAIAWAIYGKKLRAKEDATKEEKGEPIDDRQDPNPFLFGVSACFDLVGTTLLNFALIMMATSIFQMLRGGVVIITCCFSILFLKKYPKNFHWLGVALVFLGILLVGIASQDGKSEVETSFLGIIMLICSLLFTGMQFVYQEIILVKYRTAPLQLVAWEGTFGCILLSIILTIFEFIPCNFDGKEKVCSMNEDGDYYLENTGFALKQMFTAWPILIYAIGQTISISLFNYFGIQIVNYSSSATRAVMDSARTILVWIFFLYLPLNGKTEDFKGLQLCGFVVLFIGQLIYNQLVTVNFGNMDFHYNKKLLSDKEEQHDVVDRDHNEGSTNEKLLITKNGSTILTGKDSKV